VPKFSLKDSLFNRRKIEKIAAEIYAVYPGFDRAGFVSQTVAKFPGLELKARIVWIAEMLACFLPADFRQATTTLLDALPPACDPSLKDDDFGDFIYAPYSEYIVRNGCRSEDLNFSLQALKSITTRFSAEDAIRYFINSFPTETMAEIANWATDTHYHVRRLASEGTRPKLPWSQKVVLTPGDAAPILDLLFADNTRFVTRSVANHLNDISKTDPGFVLAKLVEWKDSGKQSDKEMAYIINHSLRTLIKQGHEETLSFLGFVSGTEVDVLAFEIKSPSVPIWIKGEANTGDSKGRSIDSGRDMLAEPPEYAPHEDRQSLILAQPQAQRDSKGLRPLESPSCREERPSDMPNILMGDPVFFALEILATRDERLLIDYVLYFQNKSGAMTNKKVYKLKQLSVQKNERVPVEKKHPLRANMSTRQLYPGVHRIEVQINGHCVATGDFRLILA
jgi:3-methyladenine DNA glycosylase AlkC